MLPDLELREMKSKCLRLPDQVLKLTEGEAGGARLRERVAHDTEVGEQLGRRAVGQRPMVETRGLKPARHLQQELAMRFCRRLGHSAAQGARWRRGFDVDRQHTADPVGHSLESQKCVLRLDRHRLGRDPRGDRGVAVAVAADPAADAKECRRGVGPAERHVERPHELGHHTKQRLVEHGHEGANLVERLHVGSADLRGSP